MSPPVEGFVPPPYPHDRLKGLIPLGEAFPGGLVDLSIGTPCDPPPAAVTSVLGSSGAERGYPPSVGTEQFRDAARGWIAARLGVSLEREQVAACIGAKEFVAGLPHLLRLRNPGRDTILYPELSYPSYAMGATLGGCRAVPVPLGPDLRLDLAAIDSADAERALALWVNSPGNPAGQLDDLGAAARWGRERGIPVFSDECYAEYTWEGPPRTILEHGTEGLVAVHSLSKRSNLAGARAGFYAGDTDLVHYLSETRKHLGLMVPGPVQAAAVVALADQSHVEVQRDRYRRRLGLLADLLGRMGVDVPLPAGAFYLWVEAPGGDAWAFTEKLVRELGMLVSPGEFYGPAGASHVRVAAVQPEERIALLGERLDRGRSGHRGS